MSFPTKKIFLVLFFIFLSLVLGINYLCLSGVDNPPQEASLNNPSDVNPANVFKNNEKIKFGVYSNGIKVGSGELIYQGQQKSDRGNVEHITLNISTFSLKDTENVYGTTDFSLPLKVERQIRLFGRDETILETYAQDKKSVLISKSVNGEFSATQTIKSDEELGNVLLLIYKLRNDRDIKTGKIYKVVLPTQTFHLTVKEIRKIKVPLGTFNAYFIDSTPSKYKIWLSSGEDRLPVRIQGLAAAGMFYLAATELSR